MSPEQIRVRLRPSPALAFLLVFGHALGLVALGLSLDGLALGLTAGGVLLSAIRTAGSALQCWPDSPLELQLRRDGGAAWLDSRGGWNETSVAAGGYVAPWLVVLPLSEGGWRRKWVVILPDAANPSDRRRLRVWLRWRPAAFDPDSK